MASRQLVLWTTTRKRLAKRFKGYPFWEIHRLAKLIQAQQVNLVALAITHEKSSQLLKGLMKINFNGCQVMDMPSLYEFLAGKIPIEHISDIWFFFNSSQNTKFYYRRIKRLCDLLLAIFYLLIVSPLFLVIPLAIKLDSPGPVFFCQQRLGKDSKPFWIIKFRTMVDRCRARRPPMGHSLRSPDYAGRRDLAEVKIGRVAAIAQYPQRGDELHRAETGAGIFVSTFQKLVPVFRKGRPDATAKGNEIFAITRNKCPITVTASW